jgi:hypothetical protein
VDRQEVEHLVDDAVVARAHPAGVVFAHELPAPRRMTILYEAYS